MISIIPRIIKGLNIAIALNIATLGILIIRPGIGIQNKD
jgi:hypothetical protein